MAAVTWNDNSGRTHVLTLGGNPRPSQLSLGCQPLCTTACVRALEAERSECMLISDALQLRLRLRVTGALKAPADDCKVVVLRRADVSEPASSHGDSALYVLIMHAYDDPPRSAWGCGPDALVNCLLPSDTRVQDLFPLSHDRRQALRSLCSVVKEMQAAPRLVSAEEVDACNMLTHAVFGDSWLDCENVDARAMHLRGIIGDPSNALQARGAPPRCLRLAVRHTAAEQSSELRSCTPRISTSL
jgi:hypothetical protein